MIDDILEELISVDIQPVLEYDNPPRRSTGSLYVDYAFSGGLPCGRNVMFWGEEGSGKTTLSLTAIAKLHLDNPFAIAAFIDVEGTFNAEWAEELGCDLGRLVLIQNPRLVKEGEAKGQPLPMTTEDALNVLEKLINMRRFHIIVFDSIAGAVSSAELAGEIGDATVASNARLYKDWCNRNATNLRVRTIAEGFINQETGEIVRAQTKPTGKDKKGVSAVVSGREVAPPVIIWTNQMREKIGVMYGSPEQMPGGRALRHAMSLIVRMKKPQQKEYTVDADKDTNGTYLSGKVIKSKVGRGLREFQTLLRYDHDFHGIDIVLEAAFLAVRLGIFTNREGQPYNSGTPFYGGVEINLSDVQLPGSVTKDKTIHKLAQLMYDDETLQQEIITGVQAAMAGHDYVPQLDVNEPDPDDDDTIQYGDIVDEVLIGD